MDNITSTLISQLLDKALENTQPEERLAFVEKLFAQLPPAGTAGVPAQPDADSARHRRLTDHAEDCRLPARAERPG